MDKLHMDSAPFIRHGDTTKSLMGDVALMLAALSCWSIFRNGARVAVILFLTVGFSCFFDYICTKLFHRPGTVRDLSAVVTGLILAAGFPAGIPLWLCPLAAFIAIVLVKHLDGGLGKNRLNPAAFTLLILQLICPVTMRLIPDIPLAPFDIQVQGLAGKETALDLVAKKELPSRGLLDTLLGMDSGLLLYPAFLLIILCALYLFIRHTADYRPLVSCLGVSTVLSLLFAPKDFAVEYMLSYLLSGGLLFCGVFMLTDPVTIPATNKGRWLFGGLAGGLNFLLGHWISPMAALYASICLMNLLSPTLEYFTLSTPFGKGKRSFTPTGRRHRDYVMEFTSLIRSQQKKIDQVLQTQKEEEPTLCARVLCGGTKKYCTDRYFYDGAHTCASVTLVGGGSKSCFKACEGFGDCVKACQKGAIRIIDGIASVEASLCNGCGDCLDACPKRIITLLPAKQKYWVGCLSPDDPVSTRKHCLAGCIGCHRCEKVCPTGAITVDGNIAHIHYEQCTSCGACAAECPRKCIWELK